MGFMPLPPEIYFSEPDVITTPKGVEILSSPNSNRPDGWDLGVLAYPDATTLPTHILAAVPFLWDRHVDLYEVNHWNQTTYGRRLVELPGDLEDSHTNAPDAPPPGRAHGSRTWPCWFPVFVALDAAPPLERQRALDILLKHESKRKREGEKKHPWEHGASESSIARFPKDPAATGMIFGIFDEWRPLAVLSIGAPRDGGGRVRVMSEICDDEERFFDGVDAGHYTKLLWGQFVRDSVFEAEGTPIGDLRLSGDKQVPSLGVWIEFRFDALSLDIPVPGLKQILLLQICALLHIIPDFRIGWYNPPEAWHHTLETLGFERPARPSLFRRVSGLEWIRPPLLTRPLTEAVSTAIASVQADGSPCDGCFLHRQVISTSTLLFRPGRLRETMKEEQKE